MKVLSLYPQVLFLDCRTGHSNLTDQFLRQADLILLLLDQSKESLNGICEQRLLYQKNTLPILCGYQRFAEPTPGQLARYYRLSDRPVGIIPCLEGQRKDAADEPLDRTSMLVRVRLEEL